jgi:hypothetical protein
MHGCQPCIALALSFVVSKYKKHMNKRPVMKKQPAGYK